MRRSTFGNRPALAETHPELVSELFEPDLAWRVSAGSHKRLRWVCGSCEHQWSTKVSHRADGKGCPACAQQYGTPLAITHPEVAGELVDPCLGDELTRGSSKRVEWECSSCEWRWWATVRDRTRARSSGCPQCAAQSSESKGEKAIAAVLDDHGVSYEREATFDGCQDQKPLRFDFWIPQASLAIEYDGQQHFRPVERFGGEGAFWAVQKRDAIKDAYCRDNGIELIRIPYTQLRDIPAILPDILVRKCLCK